MADNLNDKGALLAIRATNTVYRSVYDADHIIFANQDKVVKDSNQGVVELMPGRAELATITACNIFELLLQHGFPVAYVAKKTPTEFVAQACQLIGVRAIVRRYIVNDNFTAQHKYGPYNPKPLRLNNLKIDFLLQTNTGWYQAFGELAVKAKLREALPARLSLNYLSRLAQNVFMVLEKTWQRFDFHLLDCQLDFGLTKDNGLVIVNTIDNDSWHLTNANWEELSLAMLKQNPAFDLFKDRYTLVAAFSHLFVNS